MATTLHLAQEAEADALLTRDPLALVVGMLLDQQVPMEWAFTGPYLVAQRLGRDRLDAAELAGYDPDELAGLFAGPPAVHRYPKSMAGRVQALCRYLVEHHGGEVTRVWTEAADGRDLLARLKALPGFGPQKAQIFVALLGKQRDVRPEGWREAAGTYGEEGSRRSAADVTDEASLAEVRAYKRDIKAKQKAASTG
ncbi:MAG: HhH-GPD-type base excision DNA repair protein [Actinomycetes bacterium]